MSGWNEKGEPDSFFVSIYASILLGFLCESDQPVNNWFSFPLTQCKDVG